MNDIADRNFDPHVERTRQRPIAAGEVQLKEALMLFFVLMLLAFLLVLLTNALTVKLALVGAVLAASYPFFKRFTYVPQAVLGIAFGWGIPMAFAAENEAVPAMAWLLLVINTVWSMIYDTEYAMVDREDDIAVGVKSTAILFGRYDVPVIAALMVVMIVLLLLLGVEATLRWPWHLGLSVACALFAWQITTIRQREREACFRAFMNNNWVGVSIFVGLLTHFLLAG